MPAGFDAWFSRATARDPKDRWQSAGELIDALAVVSGHNPDFGPLPRPADERAVAGKSADASKQRWAATELIPGPAAGASPDMALSRPDGVDTREVRPLQTPAGSPHPESRPPPLAASSTASLDPTVTSSGSGTRKTRVPLLIALSVPAAIAIGYVAVGRPTTPVPDRHVAAARTPDETASASATSLVSSFVPQVLPTTEPTAETSARAPASAEAKASSSAKAAPERRPGVVPRASVTTPATVAPTGMAWEVRTPVKQP